jgi:hypothetical protein
MELPKWARAAGIDADSYRRLSGRLYEVEPEAKGTSGNDKPKGPPTKDPNAPAPDAGKKPQRTQGEPSRDRKDPIPASGKDLQTRIKEMAAELRKKYGLPRDTGEKPPPPPELNQPPATGPRSGA